MYKLNLIPDDNKWTEERAKAYYLQQIAENLETIVRQNKEEQRTYELLVKEREEADIAKAALKLMLYKDEIVHSFVGFKSIPLSIFRKMITIYKERYLDYISRETLIAAIVKTDYLDYVKVGSGFRVKLATAY